MFLQYLNIKGFFCDYKIYLNPQPSSFTALQLRKKGQEFR